MIVTENFKYEEITGFKFGKLPFGKPKMFSHIYFIDGLLIDTGHSRMRKQIVAKTQNLGIEQIFITHHHEDHSGNIQVLRENFQCDVFASTLCCSIMKSPPKLSFVQYLLWGNRESQNDLLPKDDYIETNHFRFKIIPIPGHASDMVALYEENRQWLFSADLYVNSYIGYFLKDESIATQINSIKSILELEFKALLCSHNPQLINGKQKLRDKLSFLENFFSQVSILSEKGCSVHEIFKRLKLKEYHIIKFLSNGNLSKTNMIKSVIRDLKNQKPTFVN